MVQLLDSREDNGGMLSFIRRMTTKRVNPSADRNKAWRDLSLLHLNCLQFSENHSAKLLCVLDFLFIRIQKQPFSSARKLKYFCYHYWYDFKKNGLQVTVCFFCEKEPRERGYLNWVLFIFSLTIIGGKHFLCCCFRKAVGLFDPIRIRNTDFNHHHQIGGKLKNLIYIACGIVGHNGS